MTLAVVIVTEEMPALVGDVLASSKIEVGTVPSANAVYSVEGRGRDRKRKALYNADYIQKIVKLSESFYFTWAGCVDEALRIVTYARACVRANLPTEENIDQIIEEIYEYGVKTTSKTQFILISFIEYTICMKGNKFSDIDIQNFGTALVLGSGKDDFEIYAKKSGPPQPRARAMNLPNGVATLSYVFDFNALGLIAQSRTGFGLDKFWGVGLECALVKDAKLQKLDRILYQAYFRNKKEDGSIQLTQCGSKVFLYYDADDLILLMQKPGETSSTIVVPPPDRFPSKRRPPLTPPTSSQITCTMFIDAITGELQRPGVSYYEAGDPSCSIQVMPNGKARISYSRQNLIQDDA